MNLKNRKPVLVPVVYQTEMEKLSKAALMDIAWGLATRCAGQEESFTIIIREFEAERDAVLIARRQDREHATQ